MTVEELIRDGRVPILRFSLMGGRLTIEAVRDYLTGYHQAVSSYLEELAEHRKLADRGGTLARLALEHGIASYRCQLKWVEDALTELERIRKIGDV